MGRVGRTRPVTSLGSSAERMNGERRRPEGGGDPRGRIRDSLHSLFLFSPPLFLLPPPPVLGGKKFSSAVCPELADPSGVTEVPSPLDLSPQSLGKFIQPDGRSESDRVFAIKLVYCGLAFVRDTRLFGGSASRVRSDSQFWLME